MQKQFFLLAICCTMHITTMAQRPIGYLRGGLSLLTAWDNNSDGNVLLFPGITLAPGIRMVQGKDFALSLSCPITVGGTFKTDTYLGIDLPLMADLSIASAAGNNPKAKLGFMLGAGVAYFNAANYYDEELFKEVHTEFWGYRCESGISFGKDETGDRTLLLLSYGRTISHHAGNVFGLSLQFIMGNMQK